MIGAIAGQGGLPNISSKTQNIYSSSTGTTLVDVINLTGSGYLLGIYVASLNTYNGSGPSNKYLKITIDGVVIYDGNIMSSATYGSSIGVNLFKRFNTSLRIQHNTSLDIIQTVASIALD